MITSPQAEDLFTRLTLKLGRRTTEVCNGEGDKDPSVTPTFDWSRKYTTSKAKEAGRSLGIPESELDHFTAQLNAMAMQGKAAKGDMADEAAGVLEAAKIMKGA